MSTTDLALLILVLTAFAPRTIAPQTIAVSRVAQLGDAARRCAARDQLLYPVDAKCYYPATDGPCDTARDEFFVLDTTMSGWFGRCERRPCADGLIKWTDGNCYDGLEKRSLLCPTPGHIVGLDAYGVGQCVCDYYHVRDVNNSSDERCYPLYTRGTCTEGAVLVPKPHGKRTQAVCAWDPCHQYQRDNDTVWLYWDVDERCHQAMSTDICACPPNGKAPKDACGPDYRFSLQWNTLKPGCVPNHILNLSPDARCTGCQTTQTEQFDRRILYRGKGASLW